MRIVRIAVIAFFLPQTISAWAGEIVAQRSLRVGTIIGPGDLVATDTARQDEIESLIGMEVRKGVFAGRAVSDYNFGPPTLVKRNDPVIMHYQNGTLGLRTEGRALASGGVGDIVEVMNFDSRITVRAVITGRNRVEVRR